MLWSESEILGMYQRTVFYIINPKRTWRYDENNNNGGINNNDDLFIESFDKKGKIVKGIKNKQETDGFWLLTFLEKEGGNKMYT